MYRDEHYYEDSPDKGMAELIIGKQRKGEIGTCRAVFIGKYTRFDNLAPEYFQQDQYSSSESSLDEQPSPFAR
jgi:replicative DNA helicase